MSFQRQVDSGEPPEEAANAPSKEEINLAAAQLEMLQVLQNTEGWQQFERAMAEGARDIITQFAQGGDAQTLSRLSGKLDAYNALSLWLSDSARTARATLTFGAPTP